MTTFLRRVLWPAFALLLVMTLITGVAYPAVVTAVAQVAFPHQANGSFIVDRGRPDRRLEPDRAGVRRADSTSGAARRRPATEQPAGYDASGSAGSNLGPDEPGR